MATSAKSAAPAKTRSAQVQQYVNQHIRKATHQVRITELITGGTGILAFAIGFFVLATIVDAWVWPLSVTARIVACCVLVIGIFGIATTQLLPLLFRRINPQYAARMIEEAKPSFKNSLVNYLSLQKKDKKVHKAVFNAVSRQAATDLSTVSVDQTIDRSGLIRMGFVLVVLSTIAIVYSMVSPKNPLQTFRRIVAPTAKIAPPASVSIQRVHPGDASVFFGDRLEVTAEILGNFDPETARLIYSTEDGQQLDAVIKMKPGGISDSQFVTELQTCSSGIQQPLNYFVVAGDGRSPVYSVTVRPNPVISIDQIKISPPTYTELPERIIEGQCEVQALEGSTVKISAVANMPIDVAYIELLGALNDNPTKDQFRKLNTISMTSEGKKAHGTFVVKMNSQRTSPRFTHYRVNFRSKDGYRNDNANIYPIRVIADLPPEVQIIQPQQEILSVPVNQPFTVEVEANDLDFEISEVKIFLDNTSGATKDRDFVLTDDAIENDELGNQRVISRKTIRPIDLNWKPQEEILLHATAADNRLVNGQPDPNVARTKNYTIKITEATNKVTEPKKDDDQKSPDENQKQKSDQPDHEPADNSKSNQSDESSSEQSETGKSGDEESEESKDGQGETKGEGESGNGQNEDSGQTESSKDKQPPKGQQPDSESADNSKSNSNPTEDQQDPDSKTEGADDSQNSESNGQGNGEMEQDSNSQSGNQTGDGQGANTNATNDGQSNGDSGTNQGSNSNTEAGGQKPGQRSNDGDASNQSGQGTNPESVQDQSLNEGDIEPLSEGASEGEQMEQLQKLLENQDPSPADSPDRKPGNDSDEGQAETSQPNNREKNPNHEPEEMANQTGQNSQGEGSEGEGSEGENSQGKGSEGEGSEGENSQGKGSEGEGSEGENSQGKGSEGEGSEGENSQGEGSEGEGSEGENSQGKGSEGEGSESGNSQGEGSQGEGSQGEGSQGEGSEGENSQGKGSEGEGSESGNSQGKGSEGEGSESGNSQGKGSEGEGSEGEGSEGEGSEGEGSEGGNSQAKGSEGEGSEGEDSEGENSQAKGSEGEGSESEGSEGENSQGKGSEGEGSQSGNSQAKGSQSQNGQQKQSGKSGSENPTPSNSNSQSGDGQGSSDSRGGGNSQAGGGELQGDMNLGTEEANLDHARQATDMVLNRLREQQFKPDSELLKKMNWTKEDLAKFVQRWEQMKQKAEAGDPAAQQDYHNALLSLGLTPGGTGRDLEMDRDKMFGLREDGAVNRPPAEFMDDFSAFLKSRNRKKQR